MPLCAHACTHDYTRPPACTGMHNCTCAFRALCSHGLGVAQLQEAACCGSASGCGHGAAVWDRQAQLDTHGVRGCVSLSPRAGRDTCPPWSVQPAPLVVHACMHARTHVRWKRGAVGIVVPRLDCGMPVCTGACAREGLPVSTHACLHGGMRMRGVQACVHARTAGVEVVATDPSRIP